MKRADVCIYIGTLTSLGLAPVMAQRPAVPNLVQYSGTLAEFAGRPVVGVTFALYKDPEGGAPIWMETQNVSLDGGGRYTILLGASRNQGLPMQLFASGEARWLGVQPEGRLEQPRVVLVSVPYALKAADAETIGGLPPSAFLMAAASTGTAPDQPAVASGPAVQPALSGSGTLDFIPLWTPNGTTLGNSILFQSSSSNIGIGTQSPGAKLDVAGSAKVRGPLLLPATAAATASSGKNSQPLNLAASAFNSGTAAAANQTFTWQAEPAGNNSTSPSGTLNLLFGANGGPATETGLHISSAGLFTFPAGQIFNGKGKQMIVGDPGCGPNLAAVGFGALSGCNNYSLAGDGLDTLINAPPGGFIIFGESGFTRMSISPTGVTIGEDLTVTGKITAGTKDFRIDHPLDPANKYLYHASVESSEMMNIYTGNVILDGSGAASVQLPEWFEALNGDFRYQLTAIGAPATSLHIAQEVTNHQFGIAGGVPGMKVSWLVTGVRHDAFAQAHPLVTEVEKPSNERGSYVHPDLYGEPGENRSGGNEVRPR